MSAVAFSDRETAREVRVSAGGGHVWVQEPGREKVRIRVAPRPEAEATPAKES